MTAAMTETQPGVCWECGGPCLSYKGTDHGWRCRACLDRYLDYAAARGQANEHKSREKLLRKGSQGFPVEVVVAVDLAMCPHRHYGDDPAHTEHQEHTRR